MKCIHCISNKGILFEGEYYCPVHLVQLKTRLKHVKGFNDLDTVIDEFVGLDDNDMPVDPELHESLSMQCGMHMSGQVPLDLLDDRAQWCIKEWESINENINLYNNNPRRMT